MDIRRHVQTNSPGQKSSASRLPLLPVTSNRTGSHKRAAEPSGPPKKVSRTSRVKSIRSQMEESAANGAEADEADEADIDIMEMLSDTDEEIDSAGKRQESMTQAGQNNAERTRVVKKAEAHDVTSARNLVVNTGDFRSKRQDLDLFLNSESDEEPEDLRKRQDGYQTRFDEFAQEESAITGKPNEEVCRPTGSINARVVALLNHPTDRFSGELPGTTLDPAVLTTLQLIKAGISAENTFVTDMVNRRCKIRYVLENGRRVQGDTEPKTWDWGIQMLHYRFALETLKFSTAKVAIVFGRENREVFDDVNKIHQHYECMMGTIYLGKVRVQAGVLHYKGNIIKLLIFCAHPQFYNSKADKVQTEVYERRLQFAYRIGGLELPEDCIMWQKAHRFDGRKEYRRPLRAGAVIKTGPLAFTKDGVNFELARDTTHAAIAQLKSTVQDAVVAPEFEASEKKLTKDEVRQSRLRQLKFQRQVEAGRKLEQELGLKVPLDQLHPSIQHFVQRNSSVSPRIQEHMRQNGDSVLESLSALFGQPPVIADMFAEDESLTRPVAWTPAGQSSAPSTNAKVQVKQFLREPQGTEEKQRHLRCRECHTAIVQKAIYTNALVRTYDRDWFKSRGHRNWKSVFIPNEGVLVTKDSLCTKCKSKTVHVPYDKDRVLEPRVDYITYSLMTRFGAAINTNIHRNDPNAV